MRRDVEHLKTLAICHYIYAGLEMLGVAAGAFYVFMGVMFLNAPPPPAAPGAPPPPPMTGVGWIIVAMGVFIAVLSLVGAILTLIAGLDLRKHRRWTFSFVMAIVNAALGAPIGTILGVFTIIVLVRPSVKALYAGEVYVEEQDDDHTRYRHVGDEEPAPRRPRGDPDDDRIQAR